MRKVSEKKEKMGVTKKFPCCQNCDNFTMETKTLKSRWYPHQEYTKEFNLRCQLGKFKVSKTTWCKMHVFKIK